MARRVIRKIKYKITPIILSIIMLFTITLTSGVFSPSPARALVGEALVPAIINAFTSAMGVSISYGNDSAANREYLTRSMVNDFRTFVSSLSQTVKDEYGYLTTDTPESYIARQTEIIQNNQDKWYIKLARGASAFLNLFGLSIITPLETLLNSSSASAPIVYATETGIFYDDGTPLIIKQGAAAPSPSQWSSYSVHQFDVTYTLDNGNKYFMTPAAGSGNIRYYLTLNDGTQIRSSNAISSVATDYGYIVQSSSNLGSTDWYFAFKTSTTGATASLFSTGIPWNQFFTESQLSVDIWKNGTMYIDGMDIPNDDTEDGYISIPDVVGLREGMTDSEINDAIIEYSPSATNEGTDAYEYTKADAIPEDIPTNPDISTYELPLIGINFPANWSLNLHGIWYYVRQWIASIASFVGWIFSVYSNLPYAMVVPIYATAVIVIVLGIYKRFFM